MQARALLQLIAKDRPKEEPVPPRTTNDKVKKNLLPRRRSSGLTNATHTMLMGSISVMSWQVLFVALSNVITWANTARPINPDVRSSSPPIPFQSHLMLLL